MSRIQSVTIINGRTVNKVAYCLLAFFFGTFGIHRFYAGKSGTGLLFILFFWTGIPTIIGFIDFIIGLLKPSDPNGNIVF
jgi:TM2 domain-containing membrane protein YozV